MVPSDQSSPSTARERVSFGVTSLTERGDLSRVPLWFVGVVFASVFITYWPAISAGFVWDDDAHLTAPALRSAHGLWQIWTEKGATQQYYPLLHSFFWLQNKLWGQSALGYHVMNIALHAADTVLIGVLLRRLAVPGALVTALVFALHPVHAESVAWISEQKNTLSALFYLGAALAYFRFDREQSVGGTPPLRGASGWRWYALATVLFVAALLTKTVTATLPAALLVVTWWKRGKISWQRDLALLLPWFVLALIAGYVTSWVEKNLIGAEGMAFDLSWPQRVIIAGHAVWFYVGKLLWPSPLIFIYPRWTIDPGALGQWLPLLGALFCTVGAWLLRPRSRAGLTAWLLFTGTLFPALGFFNVYPFLFSFVADHFLYLASIAPIALIVAAIAIAARKLPTALRATAALVVLGTLGGLTWRESHPYHDAETLYRTTLQRNPQCWMAANNLGKLLMLQPGKLPEAIPLFEAALELRPDYAEAQNNLGLAFTQTGHVAEAIPHLQKALELKPRFFQAYNNLGIALARNRDMTGALEAFQRAAALAPNVPNVEENLAKTLQALGRTKEAQQHFAHAAELRRAMP